MNVLGSSPGQNPFFNEYFHGVCNRMWDPTHRAEIRLPWNVAVLHYEVMSANRPTDGQMHGNDTKSTGILDLFPFFQTNVEETVSNEVYKNSDTLVTEVLRDSTNNFEAGLSFKFETGKSKLASVGGGVDIGHETSDIVKEVRGSTTTKV